MEVIHRLFVFLHYWDPPRCQTQTWHDGMMRKIWAGFHRLIEFLERAKIFKKKEKEKKKKKTVWGRRMRKKLRLFGEPKIGGKMEGVHPIKHPLSLDKVDGWRSRRGQKTAMEVMEKRDTDFSIKELYTFRTSDFCLHSLGGRGFFCYLYIYMYNYYTFMGGGGEERRVITQLTRGVMGLSRLSWYHSRTISRSNSK